MERQGFQIPLLIGGATTSRTHTAVKIEPRYHGPVVHVLDASRAVGVASALVDRERRDAFAAGIRDEYAKVRHERGERQEREARHPIADARANHFRIDWTGPGAVRPPRPAFLGARTIDDHPLEDLVGRIDWTPFFATWELRGALPGDPRRPDGGPGGARPATTTPVALLERIVDERLLTREGGVRLLAGEQRRRRHRAVRRRWARRARRRRSIPSASRWSSRRAGRTLPSPTSRRRASRGVADYVGAFAVTAGHGVDELVARFEADHDDYSAILAKALADRLAEAFAERLHERVRREFWGYSPDEHLPNDAIIREEYQGIRPAPGYPACPDHTEKGTLFELLEAEQRAGIRLTGVVRDVARRGGQRLLLLAP